MNPFSSNLKKLKSWAIISSEEIFKSKWMSLRRDTCSLPSSRVIDDYYVMEVPDGAAIVAITEENELVLVRQYKHGFGKVVLELPAGMVDPNEDPHLTVVRELREETGYSASNIEYVTSLVTKPARLSGRTLLYFSVNVKLDAKTEENDLEIIETILVPLEELTALIQRGEIIVETTLAALMTVWPRILERL